MYCSFPASYSIRKQNRFSSNKELMDIFAMQCPSEECLRLNYAVSLAEWPKQAILLKFLWKLRITV